MYNPALTDNVGTRVWKFLPFSMTTFSSCALVYSILFRIREPDMEFALTLLACHLQSAFDIGFWLVLDLGEQPSGMMKLVSPLRAA